MNKNHLMKEEQEEEDKKKIQKKKKGKFEREYSYKGKTGKTRKKILKSKKIK